jgi:hypothetical protein
MTPTTDQPTALALEALRSVDFDWTTHVESVWRDLPHDVPQVQHDVRVEVLAVLDRQVASTAEASPLGIPILGQGGTGKTHLLSALRRRTFERGALFVLVDMTDVNDFWETVLLHFIRSLWEHDPSGRPQLETLLAHLVAASRTGTTVAKLRTARPPGLINASDAVIAALRRSHPHLIEHRDVVRALILLASDELNVQDLGYKWLQGVGIDEDEKLHHGFHDARRTPKDLVRGLSFVAGLRGPTVLALDQLDAIVAEQQLVSLSAPAPASDGIEAGPMSATSAAALAIIQGIAGGLSALRDVTKRTLTVLSCLEQTWDVLARRPTVTMRDRFQAPFLLSAVREPATIQRLVELRLTAAYARAHFAPPYATYPFKPAFFEQQAGASPREVLKKCDEHRTVCLRHGSVLEVGAPGTGPRPPEPVTHRVRDEFTALSARGRTEVETMLAKEDEDGLDALLEAACQALVLENPLPNDVDAHVDLDFHGTGYDPLHARVRLTYRADGDREKHLSLRFLQVKHHRAFQARLKAAITASGIDVSLPFRHLMLFRRGPEPEGAATSKLLDELARRRGRIVEPALDELAALWALARTIPRDKSPTAEVVAWLRADRPVSTLPTFAPLVEYLFDATQRPVTPQPKPEPAKPTPEPPAPAQPMALFVGRKLIAQTAREALLVPLENLTKHTVILAGAGSGKTVLVRRIVEEAALLGVPSIVIDLANDLARLGDAWPELPATFDDDDRAKAARYAKLAEVVVWTPGRQAGNPLVFEPLPRFSDVRDDADELQAAIDMARAALEGIAGLTKTAGNRLKAGVLASALSYFARTGGGSLSDFVALLAELPPDANAGFDKGEKLARDLADALRAEMVTNPLLRGGGTSLDPGALFTPRAAGKTRVSVVNLSGLTDLTAQQHLVNQLAMTLFTWIKKHPAKGRPLQGLVVVDEAKDLVPSGKSVPGKDALIRLAAQARKYGLGMVFATQAPKSVDHNVIANCSTQFYGKANSPAALDVVQEQLQQRGGSGRDVATLPKGQFYVFTEGLGAVQKVQTSLCLSRHDGPPDETELLAMAVRSRPA